MFLLTYYHFLSNFSLPNEHHVGLETEKEKHQQYLLSKCGLVLYLLIILQPYYAVGGGQK